MWQPRAAAPQTRPCAYDRARRSYASGNQATGRWRSLSGLTFPVSHVCARCHRNKKNLRSILRSGSELVSLSDRMVLLVACRPRARVIRSCAVGVARPGARIGRLGASCKVGGRWCSLPHDGRCRRAPHSRAIGGVPSDAQPCALKRDGPPAVREPRRIQTHPRYF
jgi:hypothetical protein